MRLPPRFLLPNRQISSEALSRMTLREKIDHAVKYPPSDRQIPRIDLSGLITEPVTELTPQTAANKKPTYLKLQNASPLLTLEDFHRIIPYGKHIPSWQKHIFPKAIHQPSKDVYYIRFNTLRAAELYMYLARHHHYLATQIDRYTARTGMFMPYGIATDATNQDVAKVVRRYTIALPSRALNMSVVAEGELRFDVDRKDWLRRRKVTVTIATRGPAITTDTVERLIASHGRQRGISWSLMLPPEAITPTDTSQHVQPREFQFQVTLKNELDARRFADAFHGRQLHKPAIAIKCDIPWNRID